MHASGITIRGSLSGAQSFQSSCNAAGIRVPCIIASLHRVLMFVLVLRKNPYTVRMVPANREIYDLFNSRPNMTLGRRSGTKAAGFHGKRRVKRARPDRNMQLLTH